MQTATHIVYRQYRPTPALAPYIDCFWTLRAPTNPFPDGERLTADARVELMLNFAGPYVRSGGAGPAAHQGHSHLVGVRSQGYRIDQCGAIDYVAVRFRPGGLAAFVRFPLAEVTDRLVNLDDLWGADGRRLEDAVCAGLSDEARVRVLEGWLRRRLHLQPHARHVGAALALLEDGSRPIPLVAREIGLSQKHLQRLVQHYTGLTTKGFQRVRRFQRLLAAAATAPSLTRAALDCGYYDQSHFIHEFKAFTGTTPARFFASSHAIAAMTTPAQRV